MGWSPRVNGSGLHDGSLVPNGGSDLGPSVDEILAYIPESKRIQVEYDLLVFKMVEHLNSINLITDDIKEMKPDSDRWKKQTRLWYI